MSAEMKPTLVGKVALITGTASGTGKTIAERYAKSVASAARKMSGEPTPIDERCHHRRSLLRSASSTMETCIMLAVSVQIEGFR